MSEQRATEQLRLLPSKSAGYHENNLARAAIWWLSPDLQVPIWEALELTGFVAKVSGIPPELGPLSLYDSLVIVVLQTLWARQGQTAREENFVPYSIRELWRELGHEHAPSHLDAERIRRSLLRLSYAKVEREWWDASAGRSIHSLRGIIADADFVKHGRPGQFGRLQRGWVRFAPELHRQLTARQAAYALDLPLLLALPTPVAQRLYLLVAADQMKPAGRDARGRALVAYSYPLGRAFYETLGISDTNPDRIRAKLRVAGRELVAREPLYLKAEVMRRGRGRAARWYLDVVRRTGRSEATRLRRERAVAEARERARTVAPVERIDHSPPPSVGPSSPIDEGALARRREVANDPRVTAAFGRWMAEATVGVSHEMALREYRRDLIDWIVDGEQGGPPEAPEPLGGGDGV